MKDLNILVVEDSPLQLRIIVRTLEKLGYNNIIKASDGMDALGKIFADSVDLIITDWEMPKMNGLKFINAVKENTEYENIPVLMITTKKAKSDIIMALKNGVDNYLGKPFTTLALEEKIKMVLK